MNSSTAPAPASDLGRDPAARTDVRPAIEAGLLAGSVTAFVLLVGSSLSGAVGFLELIHNGFTRFIPLPLFELAVSNLGPLAKSLLFVGIVVVLILIGGLLGGLLARFGVVRRASTGADGLLVGALAWLAAEVVVLPVFGAGLFGAAAGLSATQLHLPLAIATLGYGLVLVGIVRGTPARGTPAVATERATSATAPVAMSETGAVGARLLPRRTFLGRSLVVLGLGAFAGSAIGVASRLAHALTVGQSSSARAAAPGGFGPTPQVTPVGDFYVVGKDLSPTIVDGEGWRLTVSGLVDRPRAYRLDELKAMPAVEDYRTLQCISNEVIRFGTLISTQRWKGTRARDVLAAAGVQAGATHVLWRSVDGYTESIPLDVAMDERTWLAYEMGLPGTALTPDHGFPLRVLIAGRYGMKQPKYLTEIILADHDEPGYWEQRSWDRTAAVRTYSRIDQPVQGDSVSSDRVFPVYGIASAGDRGIAQVEVSTDGASTWRLAELESALGPLTWVRWRIDVDPRVTGSLELVVRATDRQGNVQDATVRSSLPSGATGLHRVQVVGVPNLPAA